MVSGLIVTGICAWLLILVFTVITFIYYEEDRKRRNKGHDRRKANGTFRMWTLPATVCEGALFIGIGSSILADDSCVFTSWRIVLYQAIVPLVTFSYILLTLKFRDLWATHTVQGGLGRSLSWENKAWVKAVVPAMIPMGVAVIVQWCFLQSAWSLQLFFWVTVLYVTGISILLSYYSCKLFPVMRMSKLELAKFHILKLRIILSVSCLSVVVGLALSVLLFMKALVIPSCTLHFLFMISGALFALTVEVIIVLKPADIRDIFAILRRPYVDLKCCSQTTTEQSQVDVVQSQVDLV